MPTLGFDSHGHGRLACVELCGEGSDEPVPDDEEVGVLVRRLQGAWSSHGQVSTRVIPPPVAAGRWLRGTGRGEATSPSTSATIRASAPRATGDTYRLRRTWSGGRGCVRLPLWRPDRPITRKLLGLRSPVQARQASRPKRASAMTSGVGGHPGMRRSTGMTVSTAPMISAGVPSRSWPRAHSPTAATRRGSGIAW